MIPILYEQDETAFVSNGLGRLRDCISCVVTEERNGIYECDFEYPIDGVNYDRIQCGRIIAVEHDETNDVQPFDIVSYSRPINGVVTFHCTHISYRQCAMTVSGTNKQSLAAAFTWLGTATPTNPFTYWTDKTSTGFLAAADGIPHSVRSVLGGMEGSILDAYGGEYEWDKWTVKLWESRGNLKNFTIRYGVNLTDYTEEVDYSDTYTSVIPYWTGQDDNGNDVVVKGNKVSSSYPSFNGVERCIPLDLTEKFETKPSTAQVESAAESYINANQPYLPAQNITVDFIRISDTPEYAQFATLQQCKLCDSINVIFPRYNMTGQFKIVRTEYDVLQERYQKLELGTLSTSLAEALGISQESSAKLNNQVPIAPYYNSTTKAITTAGIDTFTSGASISLPKGHSYIIVAQWIFNTRDSSGTTNSEVQIWNGTTAVGRNRVFASGYNWNVLQATYITDVLNSDTTYTVRASTSRVYSAAQTNYIKAYPL